MAKNNFRNVVVSELEVKKCLNFAEQFTLTTNKKSDLDFGNSRKPRNQTDSLADTATGKIGELAFQKICASLGFNISVDFQVNAGRHNIDYGQDLPEIEVGGNLLTPLIGVDIKTTKMDSQWLLLENHKHWASILVLIRVNLSNDAEKNLTAFNKDVECEFAGFAYLSDFYDFKGKAWFKFSENSRLLSSKSVNELYQNALKTHGSITLRQQLVSTYREMNNENITFIGPQLECPFQVGLPRDFLRKSEAELIDLLKFISQLSVPKAQASSEVIQSIIKLNFKLSTASKELNNT